MCDILKIDSYIIFIKLESSPKTLRNRKLTNSMNNCIKLQLNNPCLIYSSKSLETNDIFVSSLQLVLNETRF